MEEGLIVLVLPRPWLWDFEVSIDLGVEIVAGPNGSRGRTWRGRGRGGKLGVESKSGDHRWMGRRRSWRNEEVEGEEE